MFIDTTLLSAIFLPSFLGVHLFQDPDPLLARNTCFGSTLEMQSVLLPLSNGEMFTNKRHAEEDRCNQEMRMNNCTICTKLCKNSSTFFSSSCSHSLHPDSVIFILEDKLLFARMVRFSITCLMSTLFDSCEITRNSRRKHFIAVTLQRRSTLLSVYKVASICID